MKQQMSREDAMHMKERLLIVTLIAILLTGCTVGPNYGRPVVTSPDVFRGTADPMPPPIPIRLPT